MYNYYVNKNEQPSGDHEVHKSGCPRLPNRDNRIYLGSFSSCVPAVKEAKKHFNKVDGCGICSKPCHTG